MTHDHRVERLSKLGDEPIRAISEMTSERWREVEIYAVDDRVFWTVNDDIVTLHFNEEQDAA